MNKKQKGVALIVSLVLLTIALLLGLSSVQSSRMEEAMTGNQRSMELAHMASEYGTSEFYRWLRKTGWPSSEADIAYVDSGDVGDYAGYKVEYICWGPPVNDPSSCGVPNYNAEHVTLWMKGLAERGEVVARLVSKYEQIPIPPHSAAYTCFDVSCVDTVNGNAELTGDNYHVPQVFDCSGNACIADPVTDGTTDTGEYDAYYPDILYKNHPEKSECSSYYETDGTDNNGVYEGGTYTICDNSYYGFSTEYAVQTEWYDFLDFVTASGYDVSLQEGDTLGYNVGERNDYNANLSDAELETSGFWESVNPKFVEVSGGAEVTVNQSTNTLGVIVIREGATLDYKGTSTHEGLILIEPGGTLKFSSGNPQIYGGVVALDSVIEGAEIVSGTLELSGNMGIHYSSTAWKLLHQGGKGVRLVAWYEDVSE